MGEFQNVLDVFRFLRLQVQDNFRLTVIEDGAAILATLEVEQGGEVLQCAAGAGTVAAADEEDLQTDVSLYFNRKKVR